MASSREGKGPAGRRVGFALLALPAGVSLKLFSLLVHVTSRIEVEGEPPAMACVYVNWHRHLPFLIAHHGRRKRWMMVSGAAHMAPIARWCRLEGLRLVRGASGERGRAALGELERALGRGEPVVLAVDGPAGPPFVAKPGCVVLARQAGVPLVPVAVESSRGLEPAGRWDRLRLPLPFGRIRVIYGAPVPVAGLTDAEACRVVGEALNAVEPGAAASRGDHAGPCSPDLSNP